MAIIDLFIKPDDKAGNNSQTVNSATVQSAPVPSNIPVSTPTVSNFTQTPVSASAPQASSTATTETDENIIESLWKTIIAANTPAPDYCEVKQNATALANLGLPIEKQYEGAYNVLRSQYPNFTKQDILDSIDGYKKIIENERAEGQKQCAEKRQKLVGDKQTRVAQLTETAEDILKQIEDLKNKHAEVLNSIASLNSEIETSTQEIDIQAQKFENSVNTVIGVLDSDKATIATLNI